MVELSEKVRKKDLFAFVEIPAGFFEAVEKAALEDETMTAAERKKKAEDDKKDPASTIHFYAMTSSAQPTTRWLEDAINAVAAERRFASAGVDKSQVIRMTANADLVRFGLVERGPDGKAVEAKEVDDIERIGLPMFVLVLMFMSVMTGAMHLLNAVIEEKISKISEVLLGSVTPVELLTGKLLGVVGVSLLLTLVYLVGGIYAVISPDARSHHPRAHRLVPAVPGVRLADVRVDLPRHWIGVLEPQGFTEHDSARDDADHPRLPRIVRRDARARIGPGRGNVAVPDDCAVRDGAATGAATGTAALAGAPVSRAGGRVDRRDHLGGRPDLPRRPADAGQAAEPSRASEVGVAITT
jgi:hypothetical protein